MKSERKASVPPVQKEGIKKDLEHSVDCQDQQEAERLFKSARKKLLDINNWVNVNEHMKTRFVITGRDQNRVERPAQKGDFVKIDIPGPGSLAGDGFDWVYVEAVEEENFLRNDQELAAIRLRPVKNPSGSDDSVAHFYDDGSTSTFVIERFHNKVVAKYFGRNEKPNWNTERLADKLRNAVVAFGGLFGLSDANWQGLLEGFLAQDKE